LGQAEDEHDETDFVDEREEHMLLNVTTFNNPTNNNLQTPSNNNLNYMNELSAT
jgi:hypothetical protein